MSLGSRIAIRGKAAVVAGLASTPREPLLFLYPPWIRNSSTTPSTITIDRDASLSKSPFHNTISPTVASNRICAAANLTPFEAIQHGTAQDKSFHQRSRIEHGALSVEVNSQSERSGGDVRSVVLPHYAPPDKGVLTPTDRKVRRLVSSNQRAQQAADSDRFIRHAYQTYKREEMRNWLPDWRVILADLIKHTPKNERWLEKAMTVLVPKSAVGQFLSGIDDNMWDIGSRHNCSIELYSRDDDYRSFVISGSATSISRAAADILRIAPKSELKATSRELPSQGMKQTISEAPVDLEGSQRGRDGSVRKVMSENRRKRLALNADRIPRPEKWTITSFADYIDDLVSTEVPNHIQLLGYRRGHDHVTTVVQILRNLFTDPKCKTSISRTAFNQAMAYFVKTSRIRDARVLFVRMEMLKLQMDTETFNIMLRGAAKAEDLHNFHFVLHLMLRRGFSPNARTWIAFMRTVPELRIKLYILAAMKEKGLLYDTSTIKYACEQLVTQEIHIALDQSLNQGQFLAHMDSRYGPQWLTVSSGNRILHALGARGLISRCWEFLYAMEDRFIKPDNISVNTILNQCKQASNLTGALEIMKNLPPGIGYVPDEKTYHILFELAWRARSYNLARVVWRYACLSAGSTRRMRNLVFQSSKNAHLATDIDKPRIRWNRSAGPIIIGSDNVKAHPMVVFEKEINVINSSTEEFECRNGTKDGGPAAKPSISPSSILWPNFDRKKTRILNIQKLLGLDYTVFEGYAPSRPFADILVEAFDLDREWKDLDHRGEVKNIDWMRRRAIAIPIHFKAAVSKTAGHVMWM